MGVPLATIRWISPEDGAALEALGIATTDDLLTAAGAEGTAALAAKTGIAEDSLAAWVRRSDLLRLDGMRDPHALLLEVMGIGLPELTQRDAPKLLREMRRTNVERLLVGSIPPESQLAQWIEQAGRLPPAP